MSAAPTCAASGARFSVDETSMRAMELITGSVRQENSVREIRFGISGLGDFRVCWLKVWHLTERSGWAGGAPVPTSQRRGAPKFVVGLLREEQPQVLRLVPACRDSLRMTRDFWWLRMTADFRWLRRGSECERDARTTAGLPPQETKTASWGPRSGDWRY
jgi:hypothetical protein